jgi:3-deoxy-D-manno-octulosonate 8-phosphate phosphatase (KDO 8-P phosphatase)
VSASESFDIQAIVLDVDGVLTDGGLYWNRAGEELKRISFLDIMGVSIGRRAGLRFALISGENGPFLDLLAGKLRISDVYRGCKDKASALEDFAAKADLQLGQICYMGNDVNDVPAMEIAGLSAAPADAHHSARKAARFVARSGGGSGAVRELIDTLLEPRKPSRTRRLFRRRRKAARARTARRRRGMSTP